MASLNDTGSAAGQNDADLFVTFRQAVAINTAVPYPDFMYPVIETEVFVRAAAQVWEDDERIAFINWLAANPDAGDVIPGSGGCRKVRWTRPGMGKRGGARVIYFNRLDEGEIWLLMVYVKAQFDNLPASLNNCERP
jgi:hypothetical protein